MPKTLIVYHSRSGYTRRLAQSLAARLDADLDEIRIVQSLDGPLGYVMCAIEAIGGLGPALRPATRDPATYDLVVVGTPVWFWSLASPVRSWLEQHPLRGRRFAFFCTMGGSGASCVFSTMKKLAGGDPIATLAQTDDEVDGSARAKVDGFIRTLKTGRRRAARTRTAAAQAVA
jgi:flavodoxin